jgi:hypothetical protein
MRKFSFDKVQRVAEEFEELLRTEGISVQPGSALERMTLSLYDVIYRHKLKIRSSTESDIRKIAGDVAAVGELAFQILQVKEHPDFSQLAAHLPLLNVGEVAQNRPHSVLDAAGNKIFELLAACFAMRSGARIQLEDPVNSAGGRNPDVIADYGDVRWAIACKVMHSCNPQSVIDNIQSGIRQIEAAPVNTGFVFINLKNKLEREKYWPITNTEEWEAGAEPIFWAHVDWRFPQAMLEQELKSWSAALTSHAGGTQPIKDLFKNKKAIPAIFFYAHVMSGIVVDGHPAPMSLKLPMLVQVEEVDAYTIQKFQMLHDIAMDIPTA